MSGARTVLSVDPGEHVGVAVAFFGDEGQQSFRSLEMTPHQFYLAVEDLVLQADIVICEDFVIGGSRSASSNATIEMIGVLRYLCTRPLAFTRFVTQQPGAGEKFAGPKWSKLKRIGWYNPGPDHANSAAGHLLSYLVLDPAMREKLLPSVAATEEEPEHATS